MSEHAVVRNDADAHPGADATVDRDRVTPAPRRLRVLQISASTRMGGAEMIAGAIHRGLTRLGDELWLAVGELTGPPSQWDDRVITMEHDGQRSAWARFWCAAAGALNPVARLRGMPRLQQLLGGWIGQPARTLGRARGREDFDFPGTAALHDRIPGGVDLVHAHNLHSPRGYFDLRVLPSLCARRPVLLTLHDAWLFSGHCAHSFDCERWRTGCGGCPDLSIYPAIAHDATAWNWRRKQRIFAACRLHLVTPSNWLMEKAKQSILWPAVIDSRVIPNGVDLDIFKPGDSRKARRELGIDERTAVLLFAAAGIRDNPFKDFKTLREAIARIERRLPGRQVLCIALGEEAPDERIGAATARFVPFVADAGRVARYFHAADVYVHAARADTFPTAVIEALACGRPVVASRVGGIPEQIDENETGLLVPPGDPASLAGAIASLLLDDPRRQAMSVKAAEAARARFDVLRMIRDYRNTYEQVVASASSR